SKVAALRPALIAGRRDRAATLLTAAATGLDRGARGVAARERARLDTRSARLRPTLLLNAVRVDKARLDQAGRLLGSLGPDQVLARGYALVLSPAGRLVPSAVAARSESRLTIRFADGETQVTTGTPAQGRLL
ncbi:MAG: exodeoxyribonuclease VII large subunit, partial [Alphaproteobacteria bacterium]